MAREFFDELGRKFSETAETGVKRLLSTAEDNAAAYTSNRYENPDVGRENVGSMFSALVGMIPGSADRMRKGTVYDLQTAFDIIHANNFCDLNTKMGVFMDRLMAININEKNVTLSVLGQDAAYNGDSNHVTEAAGRPSYAAGRNYLDYVEQINYGGAGDMTTRRTDNIHFTNYTNQNEIYRRTEFLYPDDNGTGTFSNKWDVRHNRNSLLYKTKRLFDERKIKTLISRFGSNADPSSVDLDYTSRKGTTIGGESRGRNLLNKSRSGSYNGYNNPYCRVWTHHHQYDKLYKLIRPFTGANGELSDATNLERMHRYMIVGQGSNPPVPEKEDIFNDKGWKYSVLSHDGESNYTGFVNIAPKFLGGAEKNIHTKQCMFSIENLAWRGYNPYEFEQALSWEQRGPLGGRIMWFPPYGLRFSEDSVAQWNTNTFIGRGENVYTYKNTERSGRLSFTMLVDHPSVLDYVTWHDSGRMEWGGGRDMASNGISDEEILQFFAGCDTADPSDRSGSSIFSKAKLTPLTDEYKREFGEDERIELDINPKPTEPEPEPEEDSPNGVEKVEFYVFFPNNYSGVFDAQSTIEGVQLTGIYLPNPIIYLMIGKGAQTNEDHRFAVDINNEENQGNGYEMGQSPITDNNNYLKGVNLSWWSNGNYSYPRSGNERKWYYRIDADYTDEFVKQGVNSWACPSGDRRYKDQRCQTLTTVNGYKDMVSYSLNKDKESVKKAFSLEDGDNLYSSASVFAAIMSPLQGEPIEKLYTKVYSVCDSNEADELKKIFEDNDARNTASVEIVGYSSTDGLKENKTRREKRNQFLAEQRAETVKQFMEACGWKNVKTSSDSMKGGGKSAGTRSQDENDIESKKWRSAKVTINFSQESAKKLAESDNGTDSQGTTSIEGNAGHSSQYDEQQRNKTTAKNKLDSLKDESITNGRHDIYLESVDMANKFSVERLEEMKTECGNGDNDCVWKLETAIVIKGCQDIIAEADKFMSEEDARLSKDGRTTDENGQTAGKSDTDTTYQRYTGFTPVDTPEGEPQRYKDEKGDIWYEASTNGMRGTLVKLSQKVKTRFATNGSTPEGTEEGEAENNQSRYDQEYYFFRKLEREHPVIFNRLMDKLKYFDPAFHSMTPEGFNARLTFLHQCTRQGNTISMSDKNGKTASNMAFGRAPFCVLRIGDFYNQMIVIQNINIDYSVSEGITWDLNPEGVGVQPMLCNVDINFTFIGGGDLAGPIRRLQNAMSFNYYANTRLYDNRADRVRYKSEDDAKLEGAVDWGIDTTKSYSYTTSMYSESDDDALKKKVDEIVKDAKQANQDDIRSEAEITASAHRENEKTDFGYKLDNIVANMGNKAYSAAMDIARKNVGLFPENGGTV